MIFIVTPILSITNYYYNHFDKSDNDQHLIYYVCMFIAIIIVTIANMLMAMIFDK